jgi:hypothetical protein
LNCQIVLVSFGDNKGAHRWIDENKINHEVDDSSDIASNYVYMITDNNRHLYNAFELKSSYSKVWCTETLTYYAEQVRMNRSLPKAYEDVEDDPHQLGGNFIIEINNDSSISSTNNSDFKSQYRVVYEYKSKTPPDRPSIDELLSFLKSI